MFNSINHIFFNCKNFIIIKHKYLLNNNPTFNEIETQKQKTILSSEIISLSKIIKYTYQNFYYLCYNIYFKLFYNDFIDRVKIELILMEQDLDMNELRTKTDNALNNKNDLYSGIINWIAGNCWSNSLITNGFENKLDEIDKHIIKSINETINLVEPMSKPLILFHGFEYFSNYNEEDLLVGKTFTFPGILSKTSCFRIAKSFAQTQNFLQPKYFVIYYPIGSKHIGLDTKPPKYDEYEYIGKSGEKFKIDKIYKRLNGIRLETFYICRNLDY